MAEVLYNPLTRQYGQLQDDGSVTILDPKQVDPAIVSSYTPDITLGIRQNLTRAIQVGDEFFARARAGTGAMMKTPFGEVPGAGLLNPVPGSVADAAAMAATLPIRGSAVTGLVKRSLAAGTAGGAVEATKGGDPWAAGVKYAGTQAIMEGPFAALSLALNARALSQAKTKVARTDAFNTAMATALTEAEKRQYLLEKQIPTFNEAMAATLTEAEKKQHLLDKQAITHQYAEALRTGRTAHKVAAQKTMADYTADMTKQQVVYERLATAHAERGASLIALDFKKSVSAWKEFPNTTRGLVDIVYGQGQERLSAAYDIALKAAKESAQGKTILVTQADAATLGIAPSGVMDVPTKGGQSVMMAVLPAEDALEKTVGLWKKDASTYRRVVAALDKIDVGDPAARAEYKAGQAIIQFADKSQMLAKGVYDPEKAIAGLTRLRTLNEMRGRGQGDVFQGSVAASAQGIPQPPTPGPAPVAPPFPGIPRPHFPLPPTPRTAPARLDQPPIPRTAQPVTLPEGFTTHRIPLAEHPFVTGAATQAGAELMGLQTPFGTPFATGAVLNLLLGGRTVTTRAPRGMIGDLLLQSAPTVLREMGFGE